MAFRPGRRTALIRPYNDAVPGRVLAEWDVAGLAGFGIEMPKRALVLGGVPHAAIQRGREVVRVRTRGTGYSRMTESAYAVTARTHAAKTAKLFPVLMFSASLRH
jgi:hypothetical protein